MRSFSCALGVKEIEPGEFHWILLQEEETDDETLLSYSPTQLSAPYRNVLAAWAAGYLALRARLRNSRDAGDGEPSAGDPG